MSKSEAVKVFCFVVSGLLSIFPSLVPLLSLSLCNTQLSVTAVIKLAS